MITVTVVVTNECEGLLHSLPRGYEYELISEDDNRVTFLIHDVNEMTSGMEQALDTNPEVISYKETKMLSKEQLDKIKGLIGIKGGEKPKPRQLIHLPKSKVQWKVYATTDKRQGIYIKSLGESEPWQDETDCEEFDFFHEPEREGYSIQDLPSAQRWGERLGFDVVEFEVW